MSFLNNTKKLNGLCEYNYYLFSPNAVAKIDAYADKSVEIKVYESARMK